MTGAMSDPLQRLLPRYVSGAWSAALGSLLLASLALWSAVTEVEIVVMAPAAARPLAGTAELRAPDSRRVRRVLVKEGQRIDAGATLLVLDDQLLDVQRAAAARALDAQRAQLGDVRAVRRLLAANAAPESAPSTRARLEIVRHRNRLSQLDDRIRALEAELAVAGHRAAAARQMLGIRVERHRAAEASAAAGAFSRFDLLAARQELLGEQAALRAAEGNIDALEERLSAERTARRGTDAEFRQALLERESALELEVIELEARLAQVVEQQRQGRLVAPIAGVVDRLLVAAEDFVERGEALAVVVPDDSAVRFEARIAPAQAAFLHAGQPCRIKLDALPFARYGAIACTVELIGRDVVAADAAPAHYLAHVRPTSQQLWADGQPLTLQPGATGWVDIIAGRRTVLSFVTEPLTRFTRETLRER